MITHDLTPASPDYGGGSIVNLMASLGAALGAPGNEHPELRLLPAERIRQARRIALVVIDGLGAGLFKAFEAGGELAQWHSGTMTSVYPPTTASAVTTFMSGLAPQQHGLTGWFMHFRKLGAVTAVLPFMPRYARQDLTAAGIDTARLVDAPSFAARIDADAAALLPEALADSAFSRALGAGARRDGYRDLDDFVERLGRYVDGHDDAHYLYAYWPDLDHLAHIEGPSSAAVAAHYAALANRLAPLAERASAAGTLLIVTADHGFVDSGPAERIELSDHPQLADMLVLPLCGEPRTAYAYVRKAAAADFERYIEDEFAGIIRLHDSASFAGEGWFGQGRAHPELAARIGDYVLRFEQRYAIRDAVVGERPFDLRGQHGGMSGAEMYVPLILAGP